ncbi:hypothetical protein Tco_0796465 [Tanacetum coccineum]
MSGMVFACDPIAPIHEDPIVKSADINTKLTSYAGAAGASSKDQPKVYSNFRPLRMAFLVVEYYARNNWGNHGLKRITMNNKGFFFFNLDSRAGLKAVLEVFEEDDISLIATFIGKPIMLDSYTTSMSTFRRYYHFSYGDDFTKEIIRVEYDWRPPRCDICKIFGHVHDTYPKKVVSSPIVTTSNVVSLSIENLHDVSKCG